MSSPDRAAATDCEFGIELGDSIRDYIEARQEFNDSLDSHSSTWQDGAERGLRSAAEHLVEVVRLVQS